MSQTQDIRLPNGTIIKGIPVGVSKEEIQDKAIANGLATLEDFAPQVTPDGQEVDLPWYQDVGNFLKKNMDIPLGP